MGSIVIFLRAVKTRCRKVFHFSKKSVKSPECHVPEIIPEDTIISEDPSDSEIIFASANAAQVPVECQDKSSIRFVVDSGATHIFVNTLCGIEKLDTSITKHVRIANGELLESKGMGLLNGHLPVVYMPSFASNLCSVSAMADLGYSFKLGTGNCAMIDDRTGKLVVPVHRIGNSYYVDLPIQETDRDGSMAPAINFEWTKANRANLLERSLRVNNAPITEVDRARHKSVMIYLHQVFHASDRRLMMAINEKHLSGHSLKSPVHYQDFNFDCSCCLLGKTRMPDRICQDVHKRSLVPFERIHIDSVTITEPAWNDHHVALIIVDDCSNACFVFTCPTRDDQVSVLEKFICQSVSGLGYGVKQVSCPTRNIRSDGAGEFTGKEYSDMLTRVKAHGEYTIPHTPQQNGRVERKINEIVKSARALKLSATFPTAAWGELLKTAAYLENLLPTTVNEDNKSPMEVITGKPTDISWLHPIGTLCTVHRNHRGPGITKVDSSAVPGKLIGFAIHRHLYRVCIDLEAGTIVETDKVNFFHRPQALMNLRPEWPSAEPDGGVTPEQILFGTAPLISAPWPLEQPATPAAPIVPIVPGAPAAPIAPGAPGVPLLLGQGGAVAPLLGRGHRHHAPPGYHAPPLAPRAARRHPQVPTVVVPDVLTPVVQTHSGRIVTRPARYNEFHAMYVEAVDKAFRQVEPSQREAIKEIYREDMKIIAEALAAKIPYNVAKQDPRLVTSMIKELKHLFNSESVSLEPLPVGRKAIGVTWAHKFKHDENNDPTYAKSRVCPQGFSQIAGVDYDPDEVAAPAVNLNSVFLMLALTVHFDLHSALYDVDAAFTIPTLKENIYMKIPDGLEKVPGYALRLKTSLNGLKQSAFNWNVMAAEFVVSQGFKSTIADPCLYVRRLDGQLALIALYVDDFRAAFKCLKQKAAFETAMEQKFPIKKLSGDFYLGMQMKHDMVEGTISLTHHAYIANMLENFKMSECNAISTPAVPGSKLRKSIPNDPEEPQDEKTARETSAFIPYYRSAVGALLWLARTTEPEIAYTVNQCAAHNRDPNSTHVAAVKRILRYCKGTIDEPLILRRGEKIELICYSDSDFAGEPEQSDKPLRSLSGLIIGLKGIGFVCAQSTLQSTVSRSTAEAEYRAGGSAVQVVLGLRNQLEELGFEQKDATIILGDNEACIKMFKSEVSGAALRHIKVDHHFVRDHVKTGEIKMIHISTQHMVADVMTKALSRELFQQHTDSIRNGTL